VDTLAGGQDQVKVFTFPVTGLATSGWEWISGVLTCCRARPGDSSFGIAGTNAGLRAVLIGG